MVKPDLGQRLGRGSNDIAPGMAGKPAHQRTHVGRPALAEIAEQRLELRLGQRRMGDQPLVAVVAFAGQQRELDAAFPGHRAQPVAAIAPPIVPAEDAHQDDAGMARHLVDPQIDRHRMAQVAQRGEPHVRHRAGLRLPGSREAGEVAVGEGKRHHLGRRLAEIDRFGQIFQRRGGGGEEVHGQPASIVSMAPRLMPLRPITTSRLRRSSAAVHARS